MLAIIIPYFKLTFFEETLQSLANQTDKRFKVYIGDDASPENPLELLERCKGKLDFVYHRFGENLGGTSLTQQWERCIEITADEEWLMILGDDDVLGENVVEEFFKQYNTFENKTNIVRFATVSHDYKKSQTSKVFTHPNWEMAADSYFRRLIELTRSSLSEYVFKRSIYAEYKFYNYPLGWHSDDWAWLEFSNGKPIFTINKSIVSIGFSEISLSGMDNNNELKNEASLKFYSNIFKKKLSLFSKEQSLELLMRYEILIKKNRSLTVEEWKLLMHKYSLNFKLVPFMKLIRRVLFFIVKK
ncbi:glycosyltransferase family 2 protein [Flavobacterium frigoris]|uniref:Glycosyl transferase, family 2 n=1 Tax=Flavobacterium frigoris (strain PS1) TaxID=1086011 RepID=H7FM88_FLAFP|nr:glycosyltransferase family 2 protein [Flavobacterium frigoris]EIA10426.1 glycosyl transferase, family 2 [Flavobacterium frigoris PS1]